VAFGRRINRLQARSNLRQRQRRRNTSARSGSGRKPKPTVEQRKENQQDRIANGVRGGQLTAGETAKLENKEAAINKETAADRAATAGS